jgi:hypothetical protein
MHVLATTPHYREMVLTPQSRAPGAWVVPEVMPEVVSEVLPGVMAPQSRVPWAWVVPKLVPDSSTAENPKYVSPSASVSPRPAGQYLTAAPQSRVVCVTMKPPSRRHGQTPWAWVSARFLSLAS